MAPCRVARRAELPTWIEASCNGSPPPPATASTRTEHLKRLAVCLDDKVIIALSKHYPLAADRLLIVRDVALDDTAAANLSLRCKLEVI